MFKFAATIFLASFGFAAFLVMKPSSEKTQMSAEELLCADTIAEFKESIATWDESLARAKSDV